MTTMVDYHINFDPDNKDIAMLDDGLRAYNQQYVGKEITSTYYRLVIAAHDENGETIGGIFVEMYWEWMYIRTLWVREDQRGRGIGSELLQRAEQAAVEKGFFGSHLETTDFQALDFYQRHGYEIFGRLEGKPAGHTWFFIQKRLDGK